MKISFDQIKGKLLVNSGRGGEGMLKSLRKTIFGTEQVQEKYNFKLPNYLIPRISI